MKLNKEQIKEIIPQREPFLFVEEMEALVPGEKGTGVLTLTGDEAFFSGHFPGNPVMPGVLLTEALAQTGAVIISSHEAFKNKMGLFAGIKNMKFRNQVVPGDTVRMEIEITRKSPKAGTARARATVNDKTVCEGEFLTVFIDKPKE